MGTDSQLGSATLGAGGATALTGVGTFTDVCDILENQGTADSMGGFGDDWQIKRDLSNALQTDIPCAIKARSPLMERVQGEQVTATGVYEISLPTTAYIDPSNRILCNGVTYEVQERDPKITNQTAIMVRAVLIN